MNYGFSGFDRTYLFSKRSINDIIKKFYFTKRIDWDSYINKSYILHLPEKKERRKKLDWQLSKIKTKNGTLKDKVVWWEGIKNPKKWNFKLHNPYYSFYYHWLIDPDKKYNQSKDYMENQIVKCSKPESAIALSHIKILKDIVKNDIDYALIMEDDVFFKFNFSKKFQDIMDNQVPKDFDILYLSSLPSKTGFTWDPHSKDLIRVYNGIWWMSGLVITKKTAKHLLDKLPVVGPIDVWINHQFEGLNVYMCKDNLLEQDGYDDSNNIYSFVDNYGY